MKAKLFSGAVRLVTLSLLAVVSNSCMEAKIDTQADVEDQILIDALSSYEVTASSPEVISFNISSTTPWFIQSDQQWCSVSPSMSASSSLIASVEVTLNEYYDFDSRVATLTISADDITPDFTIEITQSGIVVFNVTEIDDLFDVMGEEKEFIIYSSNSWKIYSDKTWLTFDTEGEDGSDDAVVVKATTTANSSVARSAEVSITNGIETKSFTVNQEGIKLNMSSDDDSGLSPIYDAAGETRIYNIDSTYDDWELLCDDSTVVITRLSDTQVSVTVPANYLFISDYKLFDFTLTAGGGTIEASANLSISQSSNIDLSALSGQYSIDDNGSLVISQTSTTGNARFLTKNKLGLGVFTWKMSNISLSSGTYIKLQAWQADYPSSGSSVNYYLNLIENASVFGVGGDLYTADGVKHESPKFWFSAQTFTTVTDLSIVEELQVSILPVDGNETYTNFVVSINGSEVYSTQLMQNIWEIDTTHEGLPFYFGLVSSVTGSSATVESFTVEPYEN